ncbi:MAG TPA: MgtC/SapB family protein [Opitutaceae bacterium]
MYMHAEVEALLRILAALVLAGILGGERQMIGKSAGLRTHMLVGVGAALAVNVCNGLIERFADSEDILRVDPLRVIEAVLTGIGFLGAGTIIFRRGEDRISGLTTAASIWATAAVGLAAGNGDYILATGATVIVFTVLRVLGYIERRWSRVPS